MHNNFNRFKVSAVALAVGTALTAPLAVAQSTGENVGLEEVVVTGIRSSLKQAADIKREASGVVDAISSEDIGKFPDTNLAESLQRITGVSIDRTNNEGNQITVRGLGPSFNLVTLNGRQMPRASSRLEEGIPRNFNFREIASDSVSGVEVSKSGRADTFSGGIGATVNVKTARPLDFDGFQAAGSIKAINDQSARSGDEFTPELSGMVSHVFADGVVGILASYSTSERHSGRERGGADFNWGNGTNGTNPPNTDAINTENNPSRRVFAPFTASVDVWETERTRENGQLVFQVAPIDQLKATVDYTFTDFEQTSQMNRSSLWFDSPTGTTDANGTLVNAVQTGDELNFWAWDYYEKTETESVGINIEWQAMDSLSFTFDAHDSTSESNPDGTNSENLADLANTGKVVDYSVDFSGDVPAITIDDSALVGGAYNKDNIGPDLYQTRGFQIENNVKQMKLDGVWENLDDGALRQINFGIADTEYQVDTKQFGTFRFVTGLDITDLDIEFESTNGMLSEFSRNGDLFPQIARYSASQFIDLVKEQGLFEQDPTRDNGIVEETSAIYLSFDIETEFNGKPIAINTGVRYEDTDVTAYSVQEGLAGVQYTHVEELKPVFDGVTQAQNLAGGYSNVLPNLDFKMDLSDDLVTRFAYSRTLTRANIGAMFPSTNLNAPRPGGPYAASQGNPNLLPIESDNFDFSMEYYYGEGSYASVGHFLKYVDNFIGTATVVQPIEDVNGNPITDPSINPEAGCPNPTTPVEACIGDANDPIIQWDVTTSTNQESVEIRGWEFNIQHMFGDTGFGTIVNYTTVDANVQYDPFNFNSQSALEGLSDSANLVAFYDKDGLQARIAYNWRDEFLRTGGVHPVFVEEYSQIDTNISYELNDYLTVFVEGLNVTDEGTRNYARFSNQVLSAEQFGPRYNFGVRAKF